MHRQFHHSQLWLPCAKHLDICPTWSLQFRVFLCVLCRFALVGGPARQDAPKAVDALKKLNVPYLVSLPLVFQTTEEWMQSELGVHPVQVALQVCCRPPQCNRCLYLWYVFAANLDALYRDLLHLVIITIED